LSMARSSCLRVPFIEALHHELLSLTDVSIDRGGGKI
jgi:hypothetical protein